MTAILHKIMVKAPPAKAYAALATRKGLAGWWTEDVKGQARVGAVLRFRFGPGRGPDMRVVALKPNRLVRWQCLANSFGDEWINTEISFELETERQSTILRFSQRRWAEESDFLRFCSLKWATYLLGLKSLLEGGSGTPWPRDVEI
jgi:uncharacterized protein YndB with AHSA1/START domain